jgi:hypothetical protein
MNNWNVPANMEKDIRERDKACVYCGVAFTNDKRPTWEHIINNEKIITYDNIALCCRSCNSSKGARKLSVWINSKYCLNKNITYSNVSKVVRNALDKEW